MIFSSIDVLQDALRGKRYFAGRGLATTNFLALRAAAAAAEALTEPLSDTYASGELRVHLATVLAKRALTEVAGKAR